MSDPYRPITTSTRLSHPLNGTMFTTSREVPAEKPIPEIGATMAAELGSAWSGKVIVEVSELPGQAPNSQKTLRIVSAEIPSLSAQVASNWEFATADIGGRKFSGIARTFIYPAASFSATSPALATAMEVTGATDPFYQAGYILVSRSVQRSWMNLEPVFRVERREYIKRSVIREMGVCSLTGKALPVVSTIYHIGETVAGPNLTAGALLAAPDNAFWGLQDDGTENSGAALSDQWVEIVSRKVIGGTFTNGVVDIGTYQDSINFHWPAVLGGVEFMDWDRRDGGVDIYPRVYWTKEAYSGPCKATITRSWSKAAPANPAVVGALVTTPIHYSSPYFNVHVPDCLHSAVSLKCDIGNSDPVYKLNSGSERTVAATTPTTWPGSLLAGSEVRPYRGGYLYTSTTVHSPA